MTTVSAPPERQVAFDPLDHETPKADLAQLTKLAVEARGRFDNPEIVEVGCWAGMSTLALAIYGVRVHSIDHWRGNPDDRLGELAMKYGPERVFETFCQNMGSLLFDRVHPHTGESLHYASLWPRPVAVVFIDADHRYERVLADAKAWLPHVADGGILAFHDYGFFEGVTRTFDELAIEKHVHDGTRLTPYTPSGTRVAWFTVDRSEEGGYPTVL